MALYPTVYIANFAFAKNQIWNKCFKSLLRLQLKFLRHLISNTSWKYVPSTYICKWAIITLITHCIQCTMVRTRITDLYVQICIRLELYISKSEEGGWYFVVLVTGCLFFAFVSFGFFHKRLSYKRGNMYHSESC